MGRRWKRWIAAAGIALAVLWAGVLLFAHPFFAITERSGSRTLVVEGWMPDDGIKEAAHLFDRGAFDHIYITGTPRPFTYYLRAGDTLEVSLAERSSSEMLLRFGGLPHGECQVQLDSAEWSKSEVREDVLVDTTFRLKNTKRIRITASTTDPPPSGEAVLFIGGLSIGGVNVHSIDAAISIHRTKGNMENGSPTYAHSAFAILNVAGIPADAMTIVPTWDVKEGRTISSARDFMRYAKANGISSFDVATLGVHARRTREMYRKAFDREEGIGIIALADHHCERWTWWNNPYGRMQVTKEMVAWLR